MIDGKRQYVWTNHSVLLNLNKVKQEVKQSEAIDTQGLSQPTQPNSKTLVKERQNTINEEETTSNLLCEQESLNGLSRLSRLSNHSHSKAFSPTQPTTQPQERLSNQAMVNVKNSNTNDLTDTEKTIVNTDNEEERYLQICDVAGIPLVIGNVIWLHHDYPSQTRRPIGTIVDIKESSLGEIAIITIWEGQSGTTTYSIKDNGGSFLRVNELRKVVKQDGQWVAATL